MLDCYVVEPAGKYSCVIPKSPNEVYIGRPPPPPRIGDQISLYGRLSILGPGGGKDEEKINPLCACNSNQ